MEPLSLDEFLKRAKAHTEEDPVKAACWFIACRTARWVLDDFRVKDLASVIVDGGTLGGPFKTAADIQGWLDDGDTNDNWDWLEEALYVHFGR